MTESDHLRVRAAKCLRLAADIRAAADKLKALAVKSLEKAAELDRGRMATGATLRRRMMIIPLCGTVNWQRRRLVR
jgi:hypothetical protein